MASPEVIIQVLFTSEQPKRNKMASRFASTSEKEILSMNEEAVKHENGNKVFNDKFFNLSSLILNGEKSKYNALFTKTVEH